jgi:hypothetical protein
VDDVPHAAPGDQGGDADRAFLAAPLAARYDLNADLTANLAAINPLTDALVAQ